MRHRIAAGILVLISLLLMSACIFRRAMPYEETLQSIMAAVSAHDRDALLDLFAPNALAAADNTDAGVNYILSIFSGEGEVTDTTGTGGSTEYNLGETVESITATFDIENADGAYVVRFEQCTRHDGNIGAVGISKLMVVPKADSEGKQVSRFFFDGRNTACIYVPGAWA